VNVVRVSWADRCFGGLLSLECGGGVRAALRQVRVSRVSGLVPENGIAKGTIDDEVEVLGFEE